MKKNIILLNTQINPDAPILPQLSKIYINKYPDRATYSVRKNACSLLTELTGKECSDILHATTVTNLDTGDTMCILIKYVGDKTIRFAYI